MIWERPLASAKGLRDSSRFFECGPCSAHPSEQRDEVGVKQMSMLICPVVQRLAALLPLSISRSTACPAHSMRSIDGQTKSHTQDEVTVSANADAALADHRWEIQRRVFG
jgi:hypothetical protein